MRGSGRWLAVVIVVFVAGLVAAYGVSRAWPRLEFVAIILGVFLVIGLTVLALAIVGQWWALLVLPGAALAVLGVLMLVQDQALARAGQRVDVVVTAHTVEHGVHADGAKYVTHHYTLRRTDGRPLGGEMEFRGRTGYYGVHTGSRLTVLIDPAGRAPIRPTSVVDRGADLTLVVVGGIALCAVLAGCAVSVRRETRASISGRKAKPDAAAVEIEAGDYLTEDETAAKYPNK